MVKEWELDLDSYGLRYTVREDEVYITSLTGRPIEVEVPKEIEGRMVAGIEKKAFLSKKTVKRVVLPEKLKMVGDYAFAFCSNLEEVVFPYFCPEIGKNVFQDCDRIKEIRSHEDRAWSREAAALLAGAVNKLGTYYLLEPEAVGSKEWFEKWDKRAEALLQEDDREGYAKQILCGEEDYGSTDLNAFMREKRKGKVRIALLRLQNSEMIGGELKQKLEQYLQNHTKGSDTEETWQVILNECYDNRAQIQLFLDLSCINGNNISNALNDIGHEHAELKALLLRYKEEYLVSKDFFGELML